MATKFTLRDTFSTNEETYWSKAFFDLDYNQELYVKTLRFASYELLERKDEGGGSFSKRTRMEPPLDGPAVVKKLVGDSLSYVEEGRFDAKTRRWKYNMVPSKMADKVTIKGELWVEPKGDKIERVCTVEVDARIFGVGGIFESFLEKQTRDSYKAVAAFTEDFIKRNGL
jgi:hypothetical protein